MLRPFAFPFATAVAVISIISVGDHFASAQQGKINFTPFTLSIERANELMNLPLTPEARTDVAGLLQQWSDQEAAAERQADLQRQVDELKGKTSNKDKPAKVDTKP